MESNGSGAKAVSSPQEETNENQTPISTSLHDHLMHKAQQCEHDREKIIELAAKASGNEVFKYMLLLNCLECQTYVTEIQLQAHQSFRWSTYAGIAGFILVSMSLMAAFTAHMLGRTGLEITLLSGLAGVLTTFISTIFFYLYNRTLHRMDDFHVQLRETQKLIVSLFLNGLEAHSEDKVTGTNQIIEFLLAMHSRDQPVRQTSNDIPQ